MQQPHRDELTDLGLTPATVAPADGGRVLMLIADNIAVTKHYDFVIAVLVDGEWVEAPPLLENPWPDEGVLTPINYPIGWISLSMTPPTDPPAELN